MATQSFILKRGATLAIAGTVSLPSGSWTATSEVKDQKGTLVAELDVTLTLGSPPSTLWIIVLRKSATDTLEWPLGPLNCDIRYASNADEIIYTPTFQFNIVQEITDV